MARARRGHDRARVLLARHRRPRLRPRLARPTAAGRALAAQEVASARARRGRRRAHAAASASRTASASPTSRSSTTVWQVTDDETLVAEGVVPLALAPGRSRELTIADRLTPADAGRRAAAAAQLPPRHGTRRWAKKGHEVAWEQIDVAAPSGRAAGSIQPTLDTLPDITEDETSVIVSGKRFRYRFDRKNGTLASMQVDGRELLASGPQPSLWRAPVWNETEAEWGSRPIVDQWRAAGLDRLRHTVSRFETARAGCRRADHGRIARPGRGRGRGLRESPRLHRLTRRRGPRRPRAPLQRVTAGLAAPRGPAAQRRPRPAPARAGTAADRSRPSPTARRAPRWASTRARSMTSTSRTSCRRTTATRPTCAGRRSPTARGA